MLCYYVSLSNNTNSNRSEPDFGVLTFTLDVAAVMFTSLSIANRYIQIKFGACCLQNILLIIIQLIRVLIVDYSYYRTANDGSNI